MSVRKSFLLVIFMQLYGCRWLWLCCGYYTTEQRPDQINPTNHEVFAEPTSPRSDLPDIIPMPLLQGLEFKYDGLESIMNQLDSFPYIEEPRAGDKVMKFETFGDNVRALLSDEAVILAQDQAEKIRKLDAKLSKWEFPHIQGKMLDVFKKTTCALKSRFSPHKALAIIIDESLPVEEILLYCNEKLTITHYGLLDPSRDNLDLENYDSIYRKDLKGEFRRTFSEIGLDNKYYIVPVFFNGKFSLAGLRRESEFENKYRFVGSQLNPVNSLAESIQSFYTGTTYTENCINSWVKKACHQNQAWNELGQLVFQYRDIGSIYKVLDDFPNNALYQENFTIIGLKLQFADFGNTQGCFIYSYPQSYSDKSIFDADEEKLKCENPELKSWESIKQKIGETRSRQLLDKLNATKKKLEAWEMPKIIPSLFSDFSNICALRTDGQHRYLSGYGSVQLGMFIPVDITKFNSSNFNCMEYCINQLDKVVTGQINLKKPESVFSSVMDYSIGENFAIFPVYNSSTKRFTFAITKIIGNGFTTEGLSYDFTNIKGRPVNSLQKSIESFEAQSGFDQDATNKLIQGAIKKYNEYRFI